MHISRNCKDWQSWNNKPHEKNVPAFQIFFDLAQAAGYLKKWQKLCRLFYNVLKNTNVEMRKWATQLLYYCCRRERERDSHNFFFEQKHFLSIVSVSFAFISWRVQRKEISFFVKCLRNKFQRTFSIRYLPRVSPCIVLFLLQCSSSNSVSVVWFYGLVL